MKPYFLDSVSAGDETIKKFMPAYGSLMSAEEYGPGAYESGCHRGNGFGCAQILYGGGKDRVCRV